MDRTVLDENIGRLLLAVDIAAPCSPALEAILPGDADPQEELAQIEREIHAVFARHFGDRMAWTLEPLRLKVHPRTDRIGTAEEERAKREALFARLRAGADETADRWRNYLDTHPNNGQAGYWRVEGVRHSALVRDATTAREAIDRARASGEVGDWEVVGADYLGETLPDVLGL